MSKALNPDNSAFSTNGRAQIRCRVDPSQSADRSNPERRHVGPITAWLSVRGAESIQQALHRVPRACRCLHAREAKPETRKQMVLFKKLFKNRNYCVEVWVNTR